MWQPPAHNIAAGQLIVTVWSGVGAGWASSNWSNICHMDVATDSEAKAKNSEGGAQRRFCPAVAARGQDARTAQLIETGGVNSQKCGMYFREMTVDGRVGAVSTAAVTIISDGQTGVDRAALDAALAAGTGASGEPRAYAFALTIVSGLLEAVSLRDQP
jgi:hypothetical protein